MHMSLSKVWEMVKDREAWYASGSLRTGHDWVTEQETGGYYHNSHGWLLKIKAWITTDPAGIESNSAYTIEEKQFQDSNS